MYCWVCDNGLTGDRDLGAYYFDEDFLPGGSMTFSFCTHAFEDNAYSLTFQANLTLDGSRFATNVNSGTLAPGEHSPREYTTTLSAVYDVCGFGEHTFKYVTI